MPRSVIDVMVSGRLNAPNAMALVRAPVSVGMMRKSNTLAIAVMGKGRFHALRVGATMKSMMKIVTHAEEQAKSVHLTPDSDRKNSWCLQVPKPNPTSED
ncbi:hypothetical protein MUP07_00630 [Candidatus Bathyarchaeota archaeon]|nr:hypothetical protein [Candidatus Bathyarchaeota archaeon]